MYEDTERSNDSWVYVIGKDPNFYPAKDQHSPHNLKYFEIFFCRYTNKTGTTSRMYAIELASLNKISGI